MFAGSYRPGNLNIQVSAGPEYPTANRDFLFDTDQAYSLTVDVDRISNWSEYTGSQTYAFYQNYVPARFFPVTNFGRRMMYARDLPTAITANDALKDAMGWLNGPQTIFWVWSPPTGSLVGHDTPFWAGYNPVLHGDTHSIQLGGDNNIYLLRTYAQVHYDNIFTPPAGWVWNSNYVYLFVLRYNTNGTLTLTINGTNWGSGNMNNVLPATTRRKAVPLYLELSYAESSSGTLMGLGTWGALGKYSTVLTDAECATLKTIKDARYPGGQP